MTHIACVAGVITGRGVFSSAQLMERRREANLDLALLLANEEGGLVKGGRAVLNGPVGDTEPGTMPGTDDDIALELRSGDGRAVGRKRALTPRPGRRAHVRAPDGRGGFRLRAPESAGRDAVARRQESRLGRAETPAHRHFRHR